jgi:exonuclease SbcC
MKILRISLRNLASLAGTHTVDFTRPPLSTTGLFSISGPTGCGKSTLLDALCLALYEDTPRLGAASGTKLPDGGGEITQKDPGNLLRRGTAEGFAEVVFVGVDQATYTARWSIRRAHGRVSGSLQKSEMTLYRGNVLHGTEGVIELGGNKKDVLPAIAAKVGLTFAQFTRAVLLAQNDFAVFLKADDRERALILQALTGTERFERLSIAVFARNKTEAEAVQRLLNQLEGHAPLAVEARAEAEAAQQAAAAALLAADQACRERESHADWFRRRHELTQATTLAEQTLAEAAQFSLAADPRRQDLEIANELSREARPLSAAVEREARQLATDTGAHAAASAKKNEADQTLFRQREHRDVAHLASVRARQAAETLAPDLDRARVLDSQLHPLANSLAVAITERTTAEQTARIAAAKPALLRESIATRASATAQLVARRAALTPIVPFAADSTAWLDRLKTAARARTADAVARLEHKTKAGAVTALSAKTNLAQASVETHKSALAASLAEYESAALVLRNVDAESLASERTRLDVTREVLGGLRDHFDQLADLGLRIANLKSEHAAVQTASDQAALALAEIDKNQFPSAHAACHALKDALIAAEAAANPASAVLRSALRPEKPCPVCGGADHPYAVHPPTEEAAALGSLRKSVQQAEADLATLLAEVARQKSVRDLNSQLALTHAASLRTLDQHLATTRNVAPDHPLQHPAARAILDQPEAEQATLLATQLTQLDQARTTLDAAEKAHRVAVKTHEVARTHYDKDLKSFNQTELSHAQLSAQLAAATAEQEAAQRNAEAAGLELTACFAEVEPLFSSLVGAREDFAADATALRERLAADVATLHELDRQLTEAICWSENSAVELDGLTAAANTAAEALVKRQAEETEARRAHHSLRTERDQLIGGRAVATVVAELTQASEQAEAAASLAATVLAEADKAVATATEAERATLAAVDATHVRHASAEAALARWVSAFELRTGRELTALTLAAWLERDEAWFKIERVAVEALQSAVKTAEGAHQAHCATLAAHIATSPTADDEATVEADVTQRKMAKEAAAQVLVGATATLTADDDRRADCAALLERLNEQKAKAEPWGQLNELIGSADGAKFRAIAQRRTLDLLLGFANAQLDLLAGRYRLERLPESLNLLVCDRDMADERRSVHSLSGGESFLVSLALALGLASLTSNRLRIESLFIDEGFGSLDPATLSTAMNALTQLESQGRKVGVISHVSEMADAIPVQIRIVKVRAGASRVIVPGAAPILADDEPDKAEVTTEAGRAAVARKSEKPQAPALVLAPEVQADHAQRLLGRLREEGGKAGNKTLREALGWDEPTYEAVKANLLVGGQLIAGKGRGGSVALAG